MQAMSPHRKNNQSVDAAFERNLQNENSFGAIYLTGPAFINFDGNKDESGKDASNSGKRFRILQKGFYRK
jgi:hypothetical protein